MILRSLPGAFMLPAKKGSSGNKSSNEGAPESGGEDIGEIVKDVEVTVEDVAVVTVAVGLPQTAFDAAAACFCGRLLMTGVINPFGGGGTGDVPSCLRTVNSFIPAPA